MYNCFASTNKGLETLLTDEIKQLGGIDIIPATAGVQFSADFNTVMKINLHSRLASRVMLSVAHANYHSEDDVYQLANSINWDEWFNPKYSIKVSTTAIHCPLKSLDFITLKVKDALCDYFVEKTNLRPDVNKTDPDIRIYNFLTDDTITIYVDSTGDSLFKRGYRKTKLEAPLKENLAAGLVTLSNWDGVTPFFDPMCGSGTIVIEALLKGLNIAPGLFRHFAFEKLKCFEQLELNELKEEARDNIKFNTQLQIYANDININAIEIAKTNLVQLEANVLNMSRDITEETPTASYSYSERNQTPQKKDIVIYKSIKFSNLDFLAMNAPDSAGIMVSNPPYGVRLEEQDSLAELYPKIASHLKNNYANWNCYFLTADLRMPKLMRLKPTRKTPLFNGPLECRLFEFKMVSGSNRTK